MAVTLWWARFWGAQEPVGPFHSRSQALASVITDLQQMGYAACTGAFVVIGVVTGKTLTLNPLDPLKPTASLATVHEPLKVEDATGRQLVEIYMAQINSGRKVS